MSDTHRSLDIAGWSAMIVTVILWVGFALTMRAIAFSQLTIVDVAVIRFGVPTVVLLPFLPRAIRQVRQAPVAACLLIAIGAGLPFYLLTAIGGDLTSATFVGVINPGMPPLYVACIGFVLFHQRFRLTSLLGYAAILTGLFAMVAASAHSTHIAGAWVLMLAALCWAVYTIGLQRARLDPITATLLVCLPSAMAALLLLVSGATASNLLTAPTSDILGFALMQGIGTGVISSIAYTISIRRLGAITAATVGAMSPALVAIIAVPVFGESLPFVAGVGVALVVGGIVTANLANHRLPRASTAASPT
ncbi:MAG: DMT family transporter [Thermomicrobiales bacterium]|nr:DMT family transporter [Thermomicrobiales bacterium]